MQVDLARADLRLLALPAGPVDPGPVDRQIRLGHRELALEQPLVDRAELSHAETAEVDRPEPLRPPDQKQARKGRSEDRVRKGDPAEERSGLRDPRLLAEQPAVVSRHPPLAVAAVHGAAQSRDLFPERVAGIEIAAAPGQLGQLLGLRLERAAPVEAVPAVRQKVLVLGVGDKQQPEEDNKRHLVRLGEVPRRRAAQAARRRDPLRQERYDRAVNPLTQPLGQVARETPRGGEDLF